MKKLKLVIVIGLVSLTFNSLAQRYTNAIGLRFGFPTWVGADFKHNFDAHWAIDLGLGIADHYADFEVQGMYHFPLAALPGFRFYAGAAVDAGLTFFPHHYYDPYYLDDDYYYNGSHFILGLSLIGGAEYTFENVPINLSVDLGPRLPIAPWGSGYYGSWYGRGNVAVRYTF